MTTSSVFEHHFRCKLCPGGHAHAACLGQDAAYSAYYPPGLVRSIAQVFLDERRAMEIDYIWLVNELYKDANHVTCFAVSLPTAKSDPSDEDWDRAKAALLQIHRAAGHPPMRNLVRALRQAQKPEWLIRCAESLRCPACDATQLGNQLIPNASLAETPRPWEVLGMDTLELTTPDRKWKVRLLLMMDMATHLLVGAELSRFEVVKRKKGEGHQEAAEEV